MGYQTDLVGYLHVQPELNATEIAFVNGITHRAISQDAGLRSVDDHEKARLELESVAPWGWSNWAACSEGCCLSYDGGDKANQMVPWLKYLLSTYLVPGAPAQGRPGYEDFTCDHVVNGMVVGSRRDNRELYAICVEENAVTVEMLWPGVPEWSDYPQLAYQVQIDRFREWEAAYRLERTRRKARFRRAELERDYWEE